MVWLKMHSCQVETKQSHCKRQILRKAFVRRRCVIIYAHYKRLYFSSPLLLEFEMIDVGLSA
jgi:hypothetical protein